MDLKIKDGNSKFKCRVNGIILKDDKVLVVEICNNGFYCFPGGHVGLLEDSKSAVVREMKEETGYDCKIENLTSVVESFFKGKEGANFHEISFYYLLKVKDDVQTIDREIVENDNGKMVSLKFKWVKYSEIDQIDFRPNVLKDKIKNQNWEFEHIISYQ